MSRPLSPTSSSSPGGAIDHAERDRNRKLLRDLNDQFGIFSAQMTKEMDTMKKRFAEMQDEVQQELIQLRQLHKQADQDHARVKQDFKEMGSMMKKFEQDHQKSVQDMKKSDQLKQEIRRDLDKLSSEVSRKKPSDSNGEAKAEVNALRRELQDKGMLGLPQPEVPFTKEHPAVGALALGEDVYTARLLLRLGFMRARTEASMEKGCDESSDSDTTSSVQLQPLDATQLANVAGINVPEVEEGSKQHFAVTYGSFSMCAATSFLQLLILAIMLQNGIENAGCVDDHLPRIDWYLLHLSKALATLILGAMLGQELMGIAHYWMVSTLLEARTSIEMVLTAVWQVFLCASLILTNVVVYMGTTNPADVWLNMTALVFISGLDSDVLDVAKNGFFGQSLGKSITDLNYELNFMLQYPGWFSAVRHSVIVVVILFTGLCSGFMLLTPDRVCD